MNTPQIGQIIASYPADKEPLPAIVTRTEDERFYAVIFGAPGNPETMSAWFSHGLEGDTWDWLHNLPQEPDETITDDVTVRHCDKCAAGDPCEYVDE